jgi:hypothetical protein
MQNHSHAQHDDSQVAHRPRPTQGHSSLPSHTDYAHYNQSGSSHAQRHLLASLALGASSVQDTKNDTWFQYMLPLIPITALSCLFLAIQTGLLHSTVEFLCAATVVAAIKYILNSPPQDTDEQSTSAYNLEQEDEEEEQTAQSAQSLL